MIQLRPSFERQPGLIAWLPFFFLLTVQTVGAEPMRAIWVVRHDLTTEERVRAVIALAKEAGLNALFVQVRGRGDAYYTSEFVPAGEGVEPGFDPLQACLDLAGEAVIEVHAWVNVYLAWYSGSGAQNAHILVKHPDWFMISNDGVDMGQQDLNVDLVKRGVEGRYLSPAHPAVSHHLLRVIEEIVVRYPVKGIHLDYARYPNEHYDFSPMAQSGFWSDVQLDPPEPEDTDVLRTTWNRWRSEQVTRFVRKVRQLVDRLRRGTQLSAAVKPDLLLAYQRYGQDWVHWTNRRYLDFVVPMFYTGTTQSIRSKMQVIRKYVQKGRIYAGLGAWNQETQNTLEQIDLVKRTRLNGFSLFSYSTLASSPDLVLALKSRYGRRKP